MKKNILAIIGAVAFAGCAFVGFNMYQTNQELMAENAKLKEYCIDAEDKYDRLSRRYDDTTVDYLDIRNKYSNLEEQVYNVMNDKDYEIHIDHKGVTCNYKKTFDK